MNDEWDESPSEREASRERESHGNRMFNFGLACGITITTLIFVCGWMLLQGW